MSLILDARETRASHIAELQKEYPKKSVLILKTNVMGDDKNPPHMKFICAFFSEIIFDTFVNKIINCGHEFSVDGDYCYFVVDEMGLIAKEKTIEIEESNPLGRLIDLDVYNEKSFTRQDVSCEMRTCLICENYAHNCTRNQTHSKEELFAKIQEIIEDFLTSYMTNVTIQAIFSELELFPKFGLVSHRDNGCHKDMDYETFIHSAFAIKKYISRYIREGFSNDLDPIKLQQIGLRAEKKMFEATNNINTHKGLIFLLGIFLPALTKTIIHNEDHNFLKDRIKHYSTVIVGNYYETIETKETLSNADKIYLKHGVKGIRHEALEGLELIFSVPSHSDLLVEDRYHEYLIHIMSKLNDTTIIHRTNYETLQQVHTDMKTIIKNGGYMKNKEEVHSLSEEYKKQCISPGGSADMLVVKIIYEELKYLLR